MAITDKETKKVIRLTKNVERSMSTNEENIARYNRFRNFVLKDTLSVEQKASLRALNKPIINANIIESFLNRFLGEFIENEPSCSCIIEEDAKVTEELELVREIIEAHLRYILSNAHREGVLYSLCFEILTGGFSVAKVSAKYDNGKTFKQKIVLEKVFDSTLTGFDVLSRHPSHKDSTYAFELFPYTRDEFEKTFGIQVEDVKFTGQEDRFNWFYKIKDEEIVCVAEYWEKSKVKKKIVELSDGQVIEKKEYQDLVDKLKIESIQSPPIIINERDMEEDKITRYRITGETILEEEEVKNTNMLPLVFFSGNSVTLDAGKGKSTIMHRPFLYNLEGVQKMFDQLSVTLADECASISNHKIMIASESIDPAYINHITEPQKYDTLVYRAFYNNNPDKPNPQPQQMARNAFPTELFALWNSLPNLCQNILGAYDSQLGINGNQISGTAIMQGAIHSSATAKPYINNFLISLNQVANVILHMIPKIYVNEFSLPIITREGVETQIKVNGPGQPSLKFDPNNLKIVVESGVGSSAAKAQSMQQLIQLSQASPVFSRFLNEKCLPELVENLEIQNQDLIKLKADKFLQEVEQERQMAMQQQMMAAQQPNPVVLREQNKQAELQINAQKNQIQANIDEAKLALEQESLELKKQELVSKMAMEGEYIDMKKEEHDANIARTLIENAHGEIDMHHRHRMDHMRSYR